MTSNISITGRENANGELTSIVGTASVTPGPTPIGTPRTFYPGKGGSNNVFDLNNSSGGMNVNFEQHLSVSPIEESGLNLWGYQVVDVAQKLNINFNSSNGNLSINAYTNVFPSATLKLDNTNSSLMQYNQPSYIKTHTAPDSKTERNYGRGGISAPRKDFSYYPSMFYKRN